MKRFNILLFFITVLFPIIALAGGGHDHGEGGEEEGGHGHEEAEINLTIPEESLGRFGLSLETVSPTKIIEGLSVSGRIVPVDEKLSHVSPRFSGVIKSVSAKVGDIVKPDTILATVQNNQNLQSFNLTSSIPGVVIKRHATLGETVSESDVVFIVADLSEVWAELAVYKQDVDKVKVGQKARVFIASHLQPQDGEVIFFSPITEERTQSRVARIRLKNPDPHFSPGAFVSGVVVSNEIEVQIAVKSDAIQRIENKSVVFVRHDEAFEATPVLIGSTDGTYTEILKGVETGQKYASGNTFLLKAEVGKAEAEHEH